MPLVRDALPADYPAIRDVVIAAYRQYADLIARDIFSPYLADLLDLERHRPRAPRLGGRTPVFAFHTAGFMTDAIALYERLGYRRAPELDFDMAARFRRFGAAPIMALASLRRLTRTPVHSISQLIPREDPMTTNHRTRPVGAPPYYLGRSAALWLAALTRRSTTRKSRCAD